jgi:Fur family ferric uptake transcriptional regulator
MHGGRAERTCRLLQLIEIWYHYGMTGLEPFVAALEGSGHRLTAPRRVVGELISRRDGAFSAADLVSDARARRVGVGRATIFRTIELFEALGVVERIDLPSGEHAYVACVPTHHHHVICSRCGKTAEIGDIGVAALARYATRNTGFRVDRHRLELFGLCGDCQHASASA